MKAAGSLFNNLATAPSAIALRLVAPFGTMSRRTTGMPALAICAAMPLPMTPAQMPAVWAMVMPGPSGSRRLEDRGDTLAAADALRRQGVALALALHQRSRLAGDARTGGAERVPERQGAAVDIGLGEIDAEIADAGERLRGKGFVELDDVDVLHRKAGALQRLLGRRDRTDPHDLGCAAGDGDALDARQNRQLVARSIVLGADEHGRGAVGQRRGGPRGHGSRRIESRRERRKRLLAGVRANAAIAVDDALARLDRHDLILELARLLRRRRLAVAGDGDLLLLLAGDLVLARDVLGSLAHRDVGLRGFLDEAGMRHRVEAHHRHPGHRFDPGADEGLAGIELDCARRHVDGLHRGTAEAVDRGGGDGDRQMREEARETGDVEPLLALGHGAADEDVLDILRLDPGARDEAGDHGGEQLVRTNACQGTFLGEVEGRAGIADDDDVLHGIPRCDWPGGDARRARPRRADLGAPPRSALPIRSRPGENR